MAAKAVYQDKSGLVKTSYKLKLDVASPHFNETYIIIKYWRDKTEITFDMKVCSMLFSLVFLKTIVSLVFYSFKVDHDKQPYALLLQHSNRIETVQHSKAALQLQGKLYSISANVSKPPLEWIIDVHIDR